MRISSVVAPAALISSAAAQPAPHVVYVTNYVTVIEPPLSSSSSLVNSSTLSYSSWYNLTNSTYSQNLTRNLTTQTPIYLSTSESLDLVTSEAAPAPATVEATSQAPPTEAAPTTTEAPTEVAIVTTEAYTEPAPATTEVVPTTTEAATTEAAATTTRSSRSGSNDDFALEMINAHNGYRQMHQAPDLTWDLTLAQYAQDNADSYSCSGSLQHTGGAYGENLAAGYSSGLDSVAAWYNEINDYDWSSTNTYNHFTQVVWKSTTKLGCAYKDCRSNNWGLYVICEYDPAGNMIGEVSSNVLQ